MPEPGKIWRHVILGMKNTWLPGDQRGWRSRHHKLHSSGDYKSPPPPGEHAGILDRSRQLAGEPMALDIPMRRELGTALLNELGRLHIQVLAVSVSSSHAHLLAELPIEKSETSRLIGRCKGASSRALSHLLPGSIWAEGASYLPIRNRAHHLNVFRYITTKQGADSWVWSFRGLIPGAEASACDMSTQPVE